MSIQEDRRKAFEAAMTESLLAEGYSEESIPMVMERGSNGAYNSIRVSGAWFGWNAALDSVVIDLDGGLHLRSEVYAVLQKLGLKVKQ